MTSVRWRKLLRDVMTERARVLAMIAAISVSLAAVGTVLGAHAVLTREIAANYLGTRPASATLELPGGVDAPLVSEVRARPEVAAAEARDTVLARMRVGDEWRPLLLFVVDDFEHMQLNTFRSETGPSTPPSGTMLVERAAVRMIGGGPVPLPGASVLVKAPHGRATEVVIAGTVHDSGLAPAWQERMGYAYVTRATIALLGEPATLTELCVAVRERALDREQVVASVQTLAAWLGERGHPVREIHVPMPGRHPHQLQMVTILVLLLVFAVLSLLLSAILVATTLSVDRLIGGLGFLSSLPFVVVPGAAVAWFGMVAAISVLATWVPARKASLLTIREAIAHT